MSVEFKSVAANNAFAAVPDQVSTADLPNGETALLDLESGYYFHLNEVGSSIFRLIQERTDLEDVVDGLMKEYQGVEIDKLRADVKTLVDELLSSKLIMAN